MRRHIFRLARWTLGGLAAVAWLATAPETVYAQGGSSGDVSTGASVYGAMCGRCHNPRSPLERTDRAWVTIANHMRVRGNLTGKEVRDVLAFLQATNADPREQVMLPEAGAPRPAGAPAVRTGPPSSDPSTIARGRTLVEQKACLGCHVVGRQGGNVGPRLNGVVDRRSAQLVRRKLADPTFNNATSMMPNFGLTADEIEAILAYLASLNGR